MTRGLEAFPRVSELQFRSNGPRGNALMAVETCSKALLEHTSGHGKSPCFLDVAFLQLVSPDYPLLVLPSADGQEFLECAF